MKNILLVLLALPILISCSSKQEKAIALQPYNGFNLSLTDTIQVAIQNFYGLKAHILAPIEIPKATFVNVKSPRYRADKLIKLLKKNKPDSIDHILGLIAKDISTTKRDHLRKVKKPESKYKDWGIFGLGYRPGASCIVSSYRLKKKVSQGVYKDRLKKVCLHELGHNFGLKHCKSGAPCLMQDAVESIKTIDKEPLALCPSCLNKIR